MNVRAPFSSVVKDGVIVAVPGWFITVPVHPPMESYTSEPEAAPLLSGQRFVTFQQLPPGGGGGIWPAPSLSKQAASASHTRTRMAANEADREERNRLSAGWTRRVSASGLPVSVGSEGGVQEGTTLTAVTPKQEAGSHVTAGGMLRLRA